MARRSSTLLEEQPSLWDDDPPSEPAPSTPAPSAAPRKRSNRHHVLNLQRPWTSPMPCISACLVCGRPDGIGVCAGGCAVVCGRPDKTGPVEVCVVTLTLHARLLGPHAAVACPHCDATHGHPIAPGRRYRIGQCGQPYIVHTPEGA